MRVPTPPHPLAIARLSYSQYEAGLWCLARLASTSDRTRPTMPSSGGALLGIAFHSVMQDAKNGRLGPSGEAARDAARVAFDDVVAEGWRRVHPLLQLKFSEPTRLPFYSARREQTTALAARTAEPSSRPTFPGGGSAGAQVELEQVPGEWLEVDGSALRSVGSVVRVVHARPDRERPGVIRVDKAAIWQT